ncbi:MAG: oxaloacetate decarboxylase (Na+ extruding) subunit alpha [Miltoncostaeaceae bacterium]|nr:oxaloacetate decarboxylase (Na+ extruding) subunit alpha [Miltoncostaeaceae bacterium]
MSTLPDPAAPEPLAYVDTTLRDLAAPPWAASVGTEDLAQAAAAVAGAGAALVEALDPASARGGLEMRAESPWDRLRAVVAAAAGTPVGIVIGARTLLGERRVAEELVRRFVLCACESGASRVRALDPLNDAGALGVVAEAAVEAGAVFVPTLVVGPWPVPQHPRWREEAVALGALPGAAAICVADEAGHLPPEALAALVRMVAEAAGLPVEVALQAPGGVAPIAAVAAVAAGASAVQAAIGPVALASWRPAAETMRAALVGGPRELQCNAVGLGTAARLVSTMIPAERLRQAALASAGPPIALPPALAAGLAGRLARIGALSLLPEAAAEVSAVARDVGAVTLAEPMGAAVVAQAARHAVERRRWAELEPALAELVIGRAGRPRALPSSEVVLAAEALLAGPSAARAEVAIVVDEAAALDGLGPPGGHSEEDLLLLAQLPDGARRLLARRRSLLAEAVDGGGGPPINRELLETLVAVVEAAGEAEVSVEVGGARVTVRRSGPAAERGAEGPAEEAADDRLDRFESPMVGIFYRAPAPTAEPFVTIGQRVEEGQTLCTIEAMKVFNELTADRSGVIREICVENAEPVEYGQLLFLLET